MAFSRRRFLVGVGGAVVGLPFLEGLAENTAKAAGAPPYAIFYRRGNGVQQALFARNPAAETERWWPSFGYGTFTQAMLAAEAESAHNELANYAAKLTIIRGLKHPVGTQNGHREGFIQGLTGAGIKYANNVPDIFNCDPLGESLDNRIARELTPVSPTSLFMGIGAHGAGGVSFLNQKDAGGKQITRAGEENLQAIFNRMFLPGLADSQAQALLQNRRKSVNDLVREDFQTLKADPRLSKSDQDRLAVHLDAVRDTEQALLCAIPGSLAGEVAGYQSAYNADPEWYKGNTVQQGGAMMAKLAALAVACQTSRSVLINMGEPQDNTPYIQVPGAGSEEFHAISHRQRTDDDPNTNIANAQLLHHRIDRFHLQIFRGILDRLSEYTFGDGTTLLDKGVCTHFSDLGTGQHEITQLPYLYVGGADGALRTGQYLNEPNTPVVKLLNSIGAAVGLKNAAGGPLDDLNADNNGGIKGRISSIVI
jgi:Protein of unknown function (DUF1552)